MLRQDSSPRARSFKMFSEGYSFAEYDGAIRKSPKCAKRLFSYVDQYFQSKYEPPGNFVYINHRYYLFCVPSIFSLLPCRL